MAECQLAESGKSWGGVGASFRRLDILDVLVVTVFGALFGLAAQPQVDADLGWHLRTGQLIWETRAIPHSDPYSFTKNGQPWITDEWLSEVIMWPVYANWGHAGLLVLCSSVILLGLWFVYRQMRMEGSGRLTASLLMVLCAFTAMALWGTRPLIATLCLASFYGLQLRRWWRGELGVLCYLPPDMVLWVNLHGGYMLGLGLVAVYLIAGLVSKWLPTEPLVGSLGALAIAGVLCLLATLANPNTYRILWYPIGTLTSTATRKYVLDWPSPDFHSMLFLPFLLMLALLFAAAARNPRRMEIVDLLLALALAGMALQSNRHVSLFAMICTPVLARQLSGLGNDLRALLDCLGLTRIRHQANSPLSRRTTMILPTWVLALGALAVIGWKVGNSFSPAAVAEMQAAFFPVQAVRYIKDHEIKGRFYNAFNWGGFLILNLYPERQVFIDNRWVVYRDDFIEEYLEAYYIRPHWRETLDKYAVDYALLESQGPFAILLKTSGEWREVYSDKVAVLLARIGKPEPGSAP
jgi:hypothetical protein